MTTHLAIYEPQAQRFGAVVDATTDWGAASPCEGWAARDVLAHVIGTQRDFLTGHGVDVGVDVGTGPDEADPAAAWHAHDARVTQLLADESVAGQTFDGHFGPTAIGDTLVRFYGFDLLVHRWDLAQAAGREERFDDAELDVIEGAVDGFGEHLYADGICKPALDVPADADRQSRILARLGRRAGATVR